METDEEDFSFEDEPNQISNNNNNNVNNRNILNINENNLNVSNFEEFSLSDIVKPNPNRIYNY